MTQVRLPAAEPAYLQPLLSHCHRRRYAKDSDIIRAGDPASSLYYLVEGSVAVVFEDDEGREIILTYLNRGSFMGEMGLFTEQARRSVMIRSRTACLVAELQYQRLMQLFDGELKAYTKDILFAIGSQLTQRLLSTSRKVGHLAFLDVAGRVARTLLELCREPDAMTHPDGMQIKVTRQEVGRIVGCSREMVGKVLKHLEEQNLIRVRGKTMVVLGVR
ncbi:DNA-binding transcriptional dual regulator CRP [Gammaproteobacteria bacterium]